MVVMKIAKLVLRLVDHNISLVTLGQVICIRFMEANRLTFRRLGGFQHFDILYEQKLHLKRTKFIKTSHFQLQSILADSYQIISKFF